jgi:hypothetical protein
MYMYDSGKGPMIPIQTFQIRCESGKNISAPLEYPVSSEVTLSYWLNKRVGTEAQIANMIVND